MVKHNREFPGNLMGPSEEQKAQWLREQIADQPRRQQWLKEQREKGPKETVLIDDCCAEESCLSLETQGLMPRDEDFPNWESRDNCLPTIPCQVIACPCNRDRKCEMPSAIKIGPAGKCVMAQKTFADVADLKNGLTEKIDDVEKDDVTSL